MKWSWKIGRLAGIDVYLHFTFLILLGWIALSQYLQRQRWQDAVAGLALILTLFSIVVMHELGHALMARRFGIRTRDITLLPIGGVAQLERMPEKPWQELLVALAGPAVNVVLAIVFFAALAVRGELAELADARELKLMGGHFLATMVSINVTLAVFNLLPAFPMDGGRVLRALLAMRMDYVRATNIAASIGQAMAWVLGFVGLFTNPFLLFIALFVWIGAAQEASQVRMKSALAGLPVRRVMVTEFRALAPEDSLARAVEHILSGCQEDFPVVEEGRPVGVLKRTDLLAGLTRLGQEARVGEVMQRKFCTAGPDEMVEAVLARLADDDPRVLPVLQDRALVGLLTAENLGEFMMIQSALDKSPRARWDDRSGATPGARPGPAGFAGKEG